MSVWQATKSFFGFSEEDISPLVPESTDISIAEVEKRPPVVRTIKGTLGGSKASNSFSSISEIRIEEPRVYEDSVIIAQSLRENKPVIVNLKYLEPKEGETVSKFCMWVSLWFKWSHDEIRRGNFSIYTSIRSNYRCRSKNKSRTRNGTRRKAGVFLEEPYRFSRQFAEVLYRMISLAYPQN